MKKESLVLVDTSVWIAYLRKGGGRDMEAMDALLAADRVAICAPVKAEILSGARDKDEYRDLNEWLSALPELEPPADIWGRAAAARFSLARQGVQQSLIDLWIACLAGEHHVPLWTLDKDFTGLRKVIAFTLFHE